MLVYPFESYITFKNLKNPWDGVTQIEQTNKTPLLRDGKHFKMLVHHNVPVMENHCNLTTISPVI